MAEVGLSDRSKTKDACLCFAVDTAFMCSSTCTKRTSSSKVKQTEKGALHSMSVVGRVSDLVFSVTSLWQQSCHQPGSEDLVEHASSLQSLLVSRQSRRTCNCGLQQLLHGRQSLDVLNEVAGGTKHLQQVPVMRTMAALRLA